MKKSNNKKILEENVLDLSWNGLAQFGRMKTIHIANAGIKNEENSEDWVCAEIIGVIHSSKEKKQYCTSYIVYDRNTHNYYFRITYDEVVEVIEALRDKYNFKPYSEGDSND